MDFCNRFRRSGGVSRTFFRGGGAYAAGGKLSVFRAVNTREN